MENIDEIMANVKVYLIASKYRPTHDPTNQTSATDDEIHLMCYNIKALMPLCDNILSPVHTEYPTEEQWVETQFCIDHAVNLAGKMDMTRSVKVHGCLLHLVTQMRSIKCGLSDFDENIME
jgi:hypothetical protein